MVFRGLVIALLLGAAIIGSFNSIRNAAIHECQCACSEIDWANQLDQVRDPRPLGLGRGCREPVEAFGQPVELPLAGKGRCLCPGGRPVIQGRQGSRAVHCGDRPV